MTDCVTKTTTGREKRKRKMSEDLEARDERGWTKLMASCSEGNIADVQRIIEETEYIETKDENGSTPLMIACQNDHESVARLLIQKRFNITFKDAKRDNPCLDRLFFSEIKRMVLGESFILFLSLSLLIVLIQSGQSVDPLCRTRPSRKPPLDPSTQHP